jgi:sucrose-6-phosphate hydrolase SacC (GH32 family)
MGKISRRRFLGSAAAGAATATLATDLLSAKDTDARAGTSKHTPASVRQIAAVRYAPAGWYMKDHCLVGKDGRWHLFAPLGKVGASWEDPGSEETAEHMVSADLVDWQHLGTAVAASRRDGCFDKTMGGIAPHVIYHDGTYFMFYAGWAFPSKRPHFNLAGCRMAIGLAISRDLDHWEKPEEFAKDGLGVLGTDCCVVRDDCHGRWLMYTWTGQTPVYQSRDLRRWSPAGTALTEADLSGGASAGGPGESPFVMKHPRSGKWIVLLNGGCSVSDNPLRFPPIRPYSFKSGWQPVAGAKASGAWGDGTNCQADDDGAGFAHEVLECSGQWYMTGVVGRDGQFKLKFTPLAWTADSLCLAE